MLANHCNKFDQVQVLDCRSAEERLGKSFSDIDFSLIIVYLE